MDITKYYEAVAKTHECFAGWLIKALSQGIEKSARGEIEDADWEVFWQGIKNGLVMFEEGTLHHINVAYQRHVMQTTIAILPDLLMREEEVDDEEALVED